MKKGNLELIQARYEAVNAHDVGRFQGFYADSVVWRDPAHPVPPRARAPWGGDSRRGSRRSRI